MKISVTGSAPDKTIALYNSIPSFFWSVIHLTPVAVYCYNSMSLHVVLAFSFLSSLPVLLPDSFFDRIRLGKTVSLYKKLGVGFINKFTQHGSIINALIRKKHPGYRVLSADRRSVLRILKRTYFFEKFHFMLFVFFLLTTVHAALEHHLAWVLILSVTNLLYNVYPGFLQQYIRLKLASVKQRAVRQAL